MTDASRPGPPFPTIASSPSLIASRASQGARMRHRGSFTTTAATAILGESRGAKPTNHE